MAQTSWGLGTAQTPEGGWFDPTKDPMYAARLAQRNANLGQWQTDFNAQFTPQATAGINSSPEIAGMNEGDLVRLYSSLGSDDPRRAQYEQELRKRIPLGGTWGTLINKYNAGGTGYDFNKSAQSYQDSAMSSNNPYMKAWISQHPEWTTAVQGQQAQGNAGGVYNPYSPPSSPTPTTTPPLYTPPIIDTRTGRDTRSVSTPTTPTTGLSTTPNHMQPFSVGRVNPNNFPKF